MEAMLFAAGLGTRLRPLTDRVPKALVEVAGLPMLERVARRLVAAGVDRLIVNVHPFAERIQRYLRERNGFGVRVVISHETDEPLETGGGLAHARRQFKGKAPFFLHNVDVLTDLPLGSMYAAHLDHAPLATLAVMERPTSRHLLFDDHGLLGRTDTTKDLDLRTRPPRGEVRRLAFSGVHVVSPDILDSITERGVFSILEPYLRLAATGARILPFRVDGSLWLDVGRPQQLEEAQRLIAQLEE